LNCEDKPNPRFRPFPETIGQAGLKLLGGKGDMGENTAAGK
jgi:hypothetical protein